MTIDDADSTAIRTEMLHDDSISFEAKGLLCYYLSLQGESQDIPDEDIPLIGELIEAGYVSVEEENGAQIYSFFDMPL